MYYSLEPKNISGKLINSKCSIDSVGSGLQGRGNNGCI